MGRSLSSVLRQQLVNLEKDADSHKSAMKALKSYIKDLDIHVIPSFLAQVFETKETGVSSGDYTVSLFENLARVHGAKIVPHIENIMSTIIKTLASSADSFPLQQACSKVVSAIARYGIDPGTPADKKRHIIHSLCKPLSDSLLDSQESLASGSALCLKALVDCDNWRCASDEMVNMVCQNIAVALEMNSSKTHSYMALVMALAKHNPFIIEAYARLLVHSALRILDSGVVDGSSQKRLLAIQMLNYLMKNLDPESMYSEIEMIIAEMEKCQCDEMHFVKMAAYEAMKTAQKIDGEKESKFKKSSGSATGSNFTGRNLISASDCSFMSAAADSRYLDSLIGYDAPSPMAHGSCKMGNDGWSVTYKLKRCDRGKANVDDLFSDVVEGSNIPGSPPVQENPRNGFPRSATPSSQRGHSHVNVDEMDAFVPTRNLNAEFSDRQNGSFRKLKGSRKHHHHHGFVHDLFDELRENGKLYVDGSGQSEEEAKSISSIDDDPLTDTSTQMGLDSVDQTKTQMTINHVKKGRSRSALRLGLSLFSVVVAGFASFMWVYDQDEAHGLVPT